jgi:hypothetical protein
VLPEEATNDLGVQGARYSPTIASNVLRREELVERNGSGHRAKNRPSGGAAAYEGERLARAAWLAERLGLERPLA